MLVPARNEAEVIGASVRALLAESSALASIVVIDDGSTDGTRAILDDLAASHPKLTVLAGTGPRPGQCGKPAALVAAYESVHPATEWLLFVDADVVVEPGSLRALLAAAEGVDLVTIIPRIEMTRAIEKLVMPSIGALVLARFPPERVLDAGDRLAFANGQVILIRRSLYEALGTHRAVITEILEDVRLAERAKAAGGRILVADGRALAVTRMYAGWAELLEGWAKNLHLLLGGRASSSLGWLVVSVALAWSGVTLALVFGWPVGVAGWLAILAFQMILRAKGGASPAWAILAPISALLVGRVILRSLALHHRARPIPWKGRVY